MTKSVSSLYNQKLALHRQVLNSAKESLKDMAPDSIFKRIFAVQHDGWSSLAADGYLGRRVTY